MIRRVLMSPRIAGLKDHRGEIVGEATWPAIIDRATHDRLVGLLGNPERRPANYGRPRVYPLAGLLRCGSCGGKLITYLQPRQGRGYGCRKDENLVCPGRVRIAAEPLEEYVAGYVIEHVEEPASPQHRAVRRRPDGAHQRRSAARWRSCKNRRTRR